MLFRSRDRVYEITGIQFLTFNTLYQLVAASQSTPRLLDAATGFGTIPDIFNYLLTGELRAEYTSATTTQMVDTRARRWAYESWAVQTRRAGDPRYSMFPRVVERRPSRIEFAAGQPGALIFVADSGSGVAPEDREKVFEPFFTTKEPGRGTGLGLAIVARSVHDMGGVVWVDAAREGGAAFKLFFPIALPR